MTPMLKVEIVAAFSMPAKKSRGRTKLLGNRMGYIFANQDMDGKKRIYLMSQYQSV